MTTATTDQPAAGHASIRKPSRAWPEQEIAGVLMHFSSLPSPHGIGDIADASRAFIDQLAAMKLRAWQALPTGPTGFGDSPYQSLSTFAGNEMLVGFDPLIRDGLLRASEVEPLHQLPFGSVEYGQLIPLKSALLKLAAERFHQAKTLSADYQSFLERNNEPWLHDYALFRVLKSGHGERPWPQWEAPLAHRENAAIREASEQHREAIERIKVVQYFFSSQWLALREYAADNGIRLFGDMPFYIALDSADAWAGRELLQTDDDGQPSHVAGVPPDYFSADGQLWGNPLYDWARQARDGYRWWISRFKAAVERADMTRVDHFRGFQSYWSIPAGAKTARVGVWLPGPGVALFDAVANALGDLPVIAEDLGIITDEVEHLRRRQGIPGMKVLHFELADPDFDPADITADCVCYTATHDNETTAAWFAGAQRGERTRKEIRKTRKNALRHTNGKARTMPTDLIRLAFSTRARVAMAPMQDYLGLGAEARLNRPGSSDGNWRWRMLPGQLSNDRMAEIEKLVETHQRG